MDPYKTLILQLTIIETFKKLHGEAHDKYAWSKQVYDNLCKRLREYREEGSKWKFYIENTPPILIVYDVESKILESKYNEIHKSDQNPSIRSHVLALQSYLEKSKFYDPKNSIYNIEFLRLYVQNVTQNNVTAEDISAYLQKKSKEDDMRSFTQVAFSVCTLM
jgi:hypothetical protein